LIELGIKKVHRNQYWSTRSTKNELKKHNRERFAEDVTHQRRAETAAVVRQSGVAVWLDASIHAGTESRKNASSC